MAVTYNAGYTIRGLSTDTKPLATTFAGWTFIETDTGHALRAYGGSWVDMSYHAGQAAAGLPFHQHPVPLLDDSGVDGEAGPPGARGADGAAGVAGVQGPPGPAIFLDADPGDEGQTGPVGPQGIAGNPGTTGAQGPTGPAIFLLDEAADGEAGPPGLRGVDGASGSPGAQGIAGPAVAMFAQDGEDGMTLPGPQGPKGADGAPGAGGTWTTKVRIADQTNNTSTLADDDTLQFNTVANTQYTVRLLALFLTNSTADSKYRLVHTGTTTRVRRRVSRTATTDVSVTVELKTAFDAADVVLSTTGTNPWLEEDIIIQVGASGGVLKLQWAQGTTNAGPTSCLEGSYLEYAAA